MKTEIYVWFDYCKPSGSRCSQIDWAGQIDIEKAKQIVDKITAREMLKVQTSRFFAEDVSLSISIQEIKTGLILYKRSVL